MAEPPAPEEPKAVEDPGVSLTQTLTRAGAVEVAADLVEAPLDALLQPGILESIPLLGTMVGVGKAGLAIRDYLFTRKLIGFLAALKDVSEEERRAMVARLEADSSFGKKVGEEIILLLARLDALEKAKLVGRAFRAYAKGLVDAETLQRMNYAIDRIMLRDLRQLRAFLKDSHSVSDRTLHAMVNAGLVRIGGAMQFAPQFSSVSLSPDESLCGDLVKHVLT